MKTQAEEARSINRRGLLTIEQHDEALEALIAAGSAVEESQSVPGRTVRSGIGCPQCSQPMIDVPGEEKTDPDGLKFRKCGCFRCGTSVWRRTP